MEPQPSVRLLWTPTERQTLWAAVSRAVRIPALVEDKLRANLAIVPSEPPVVVSVQQSSVPSIEELIAAELGFRTRWSEVLSLDVAGYYHLYHDMTYGASAACQGELALDRPNINCPIVFSKSMGLGTAYGIEIAADSRIREYWRLRAGYTYQQIDYGLPPGSLAGLTTVTGSPDPKHQFYVRSSLDLPYDLYFDIGLRYVDRLPAFRLNDYITLDTRLAWKPSKRIELALVGQNLVTDPHQEFGPQVFYPAVAVTPSYFAQLRLQF